MKRALMIAFAAAWLGGASGCFLFHDDYPDDSCETDLECFVSQGETCNVRTSRCEVSSESAPAPVPDVIVVSEDGTEEEVSYADED